MDLSSLPTIIIFGFIFVILLAILIAMGLLRIFRGNKKVKHLDPKTSFVIIIIVIAVVYYFFSKYF